jgi:hypothetical protein
MADIDAQRLAQYRRDGFIIVEGLLDEVTRRRMKQVLAELIEGARAVRTHDDVYDLEPTHSACSLGCGASRSRIWCIRCLRSSCVAAAAGRVERAAGPERRTAARLEAQPEGAEIGSPVEWHQDWAFYPHTNDDLLAGRRAARRRHRTERADDGAAGQPPRPHLRPPRLRRPLLRRDGAGPRRARLPACPGPDRTGGGLLVPPRARGARLGSEHLGTLAQPAALRVCRGRCLPAARHPDWDEFNARLLVGEPTVAPRTVDCPIRMPLPPAANQGSIYENQTALQRRYFEPAPVAVPRQST